MGDGQGADTPFIGRERELAALSSSLRHAQVVTVAGPRGCGKTRLAREAAERLAGDIWPERAVVLVVEAATVRSVAELASAIGHALGEPPHRATLELLARRLGRTATVVVLDDCRSAAAAIEVLAAALPPAAPARFILTSREPLRIPGEVVLALDGLSLPGSGAGLAELVRSDAARLLVASAAELDGDFALTPAVVDAILGTCHTLKGAPLGLAMAARRLARRRPGQSLEGTVAFERAVEIERAPAPPGQADDLPTTQLVEAARVMALVRADRAAEARTLALESLARTAKEQENPERAPVQRATSRMQIALAMAELALGDLEAAQRLIGPVAQSRAPEQALALEVLARVALERGDTAVARGRARHLDGLALRHDSPHTAALARYCEGYAALQDGELAAAGRALQSALSGATRSTDALLCLEVLGALGALAAFTAHPRRAARLLGATFAARARMRTPRLPPLRHEAQALERLAAKGDWTAEWSAGEALALDQAVAYARRARGPRVRAVAGVTSLTSTEQEVAQLVTAGATNPQIAAELFMARGTVKAHLASIYRKLGVANRTALAAEMARAADTDR